MTGFLQMCNSPDVERRIPILVMVIACISFAACGTTPQVNPDVSAALASRGVEQSTAEKVNSGRVLGYEDIRNLVAKGVPSNIIIAYLQSTRKVYNFTYAQLQGLKAAGATPQLLNYLSETQGFYGSNSPRQRARTDREQKDRYYNSPLAQDQAPFAYNPPIIDDWYDSAYEESLYSPFSFN